MLYVPVFFWSGFVNSWMALLYGKSCYMIFHINLTSKINEEGFSCSHDPTTSTVIKLFLSQMSGQVPIADARWSSPRLGEDQWGPWGCSFSFYYFCKMSLKGIVTICKRGHRVTGFLSTCDCLWVTEGSNTHHTFYKVKSFELVAWRFSAHNPSPCQFPVNDFFHVRQLSCMYPGQTKIPDLTTVCNYAHMT